MKSAKGKVLVTGASGLLGRAVLARLLEDGWQAKGTALTRASGELVQMNLLDTSSLETLLSSFKPDVVVHCAAERRPDVAEKDPEAARRLNITLPRTLSSLSLTHSFALIYISTDYVFDGEAPPSGGYTSTSPTGPTNEYARSKFAGEEAVRQGWAQGGKGCILRVPVLYGPVTFPSESAINVLLSIVRSCSPNSLPNPIKMDHYALRRPTNVLDVARPAWTKYDICRLLARMEGIDVEGKLEAVTDGPKQGETKRPRDCWMSNAEIEALGVDTTCIDFEAWWKDWLARDPVSPLCKPET